MACNCNNGQTYLNSLVPLPGATAASATYVMELTHYTCGNRKICINGAFPLTANLNYTILGIQSVGNNAYNLDVLVSGTCTYMPYRQGQNCGCGCQGSPCPVTENIWTTISVPVASETEPTITAGTCKVSPANVKDCCNVTNAVAITTSFNVATTTQASGNAKSAK